MKYRPLYFQKKEFLCPCCRQGGVVPALVYFLDHVRRAWDGPIVINSGYRCHHHNIEVGGAEQSRHKIGCAADIRPADRTLIGPFQFLLQHLVAQQEGWELKLYPTFVHVAVPRTEAGTFWNGGVLTIAAK